MGSTLASSTPTRWGLPLLEDYDRFFVSSFGWVRDQPFAQSIGIKVGQEVIYDPRRAFDMWNTRYFIVPFDANGWRDSTRGLASFLFQRRSGLSRSRPIRGRNGSEEARNWIETKDFRVMRNRAEYPRAWVVHRRARQFPARRLPGI